MQEKLLKKILSGFAGQDAEKLVDLLYKKKNVNEFLIAKKLGMTINQTRNMLYKLADSGLVQFIRKKDKKKGGWYTYFWTLKIRRSLAKYKEKTEQEINKLKEHLEKLEKERYYYCANDDIDYTEESALLNDYTCPECGEILQIKETAEVSGNIKNSIKKLKDEVARVEQEIQTIEEKEQKVKNKQQKAEQKMKEDEKRKKHLAREREKKKLAKKTEKRVKRKVKKIKKKKFKTKKKAKKHINKKTKKISKSKKRFKKRKRR